MNAREKAINYRAGIALLDRRFQWRDGDIKINVDNDDEHEVAKAIVAIEKKKQGRKIIVEAIFQAIKRRADIFDPEMMEVTEIYHSETKQSLDRKRAEYETIGVGVVFVQATEIVNAWLRKR